MRGRRIEEILNRTFAPVTLEVIDESQKHAGHAGAQPGGETHYRIHIVSEKFAGRNRIERQRLVNAALKDEFDSGLHALAMTLQGPDDVNAD
jgi:BolA protein